MMNDVPLVMRYNQFSTLEKKQHAFMRIIVGFLSKLLRHLKTNDYSAYLSIYLSIYLYIYIGLPNLR